MNTILITIFFTLLVYSIISTFIFIITNENEIVITCFGLGIFGCILLVICKFIYFLHLKIKHFYQRTIFLEKQTNEKKYCLLKNSKYIELGNNDFVLIKRYAKISEWKKLKAIKKEIIEKSKENYNSDF